MSLALPLRAGCAYSFHYPRYNYLGLPTQMEIRRIVVEEIRDTRCQPLESVTVARNPSLRRGRWLVMGHDLDRDARRSFYFESMINVVPLTNDQRDPFRTAVFVVMTALGKVVFQGSQLDEALDVLMQRPAGFVCRVVGRSN